MSPFITYSKPQRFVRGVVLPAIQIRPWIIIFGYFKMNYLWFLISFFPSQALLLLPSYWVSLLRSHFLSLGWDNPPCRGLQSAGRPGKSLNYPFALKLEPNHNSPRSVRLRTPASLGLIVGLDFFSLLLLHRGNRKMKLNQNKREKVWDVVAGDEIVTLFESADLTQRVFFFKKGVKMSEAFESKESLSDRLSWPSV